MMRNVRSGAHPLLMDRKFRPLWAALLVVGLPALAQSATADERRTTNDQRPTTKAGAVVGEKQPSSLVVRRSSFVTYARDVAPILQANCQTCHRKGEVAPFALSSYEDAKRWAKAIKTVTGRRVMPPWRAAPGYGEFLNARGLTDAQIATLARWVDAGAPRGNPKDLPPPRTFPDGWAMGEPDLVLEPSEEYHLAADGRDVYRCFVLPARFADERYVAGIEARPGNRSVVHHVIAYLDTSGTAEKLDAADSEPGYTGTAGFPGFAPAGILGGWVPGNTPARLPDGIGNLMPANARVVMEVHYHKSGKPETDRTRLGIYFARGPVDKRLRIAPIVNMGLRIPAGARSHEVRAGWTAPRDMHALSVIPHMHMLGRDIRVTAFLPDGKPKPLVWVKDWDFNWQETYAFKEPLAFPAGTRFEVVSHYDNTEQNPRNPNHPPRDVTWGEQTTDEMCVAFIGYLLDAEHLTQGPGPAPTAAPPVNVAGTWAITMATPIGPTEATATIQQEGDQITGTYRARGGEAPLTGTVRGDQISFRLTSNRAERELRVSFDGKLSGESLSGAWEFGSLASGTWTANRKAAEPTAATGTK